MARWLLLIGIGLLAWGASLAGPFHFDDYNLFVDPVITSTRGWYQVWRPIQTRPLSQFTFWLSFALAGATPWAFHVWNLALHATASLLVWRTLRMVVAERAAVTAAVMFAIHPVQAEVVNYVFARSTALSTVLCLVVFWLWLRDRIWPAVALFALALLAKEECVTFPLFLALVDWSRGKRRWNAVGTMLGLAFLLGLRVLIATKFVPQGGGGFASRITPFEYFTAQGLVIVRYLRLLVVPWGFTVDPEIRIVVPWLAWTTVVAVAGIAWQRVKSWGVWIFGALILLIPSSSIFPADDLAADRRMYLPMIAVCAAFGVFAVRVNRRALVVVGVLLVALSSLRTQVWNSERRLWEEAVERSPDKVRPRIQLARSLPEASGVTVLEEASRRFPNEFDIETERGRLLLATARPLDALGAFGKALALRPSSAMALNNRGVALAAMGQIDAARGDFERALKADPCFGEASSNLRKLGISVADGSALCR